MNELAAYCSPLELVRWHLQFRAGSAGLLPAWLGSTWRGLFGHALRDAVCQCDRRDANTCALKATCPYIALFEPRNGSIDTLLHPAQAAPAPFMLCPAAGGNIEADQILEVTLTLFGKARRHSGLVIRALIMGAMQGIGRERLPLQPDGLVVLDADGQTHDITLSELDDGHVPRIIPISTTPPWPGKARLHFTSPLRMRLRNRYIGPEELRFGDLVAQLLRRASLLRDFHCHHDAVEPELDFRAWVEHARALDFVETRLTWQDLARQSSRQQRRVPMGGVIGECVIAGDEFEPYWPLLWLGQWLGAGKGTTMGLGQYQCEADG